MEIAIASLWIWARGTDFADFDSDDFRGIYGGRLGFWIAVTAPGDERPSDLEKRSRVLNHNLKRSQSPGGDEADGPAPLLNPGVDDLDIGEIAGSNGSSQELALPGRALD